MKTRLAILFVTTLLGCFILWLNSKWLDDADVDAHEVGVSEKDLVQNETMQLAVLLASQNATMNLTNAGDSHEDPSPHKDDSSKEAPIPEGVHIYLKAYRSGIGNLFITLRKCAIYHEELRVQVHVNFHQVPGFTDFFNTPLASSDKPHPKQNCSKFPDGAVCPASFVQNTGRLKNAHKVREICEWAPSLATSQYFQTPKFLRKYFPLNLPYIHDILLPQLGYHKNLTGRFPVWHVRTPEGESKIFDFVNKQKHVLIQPVDVIAKAYKSVEQAHHLNPETRYIASNSDKIYDVSKQLNISFLQGKSNNNNNNETSLLGVGQRHTTTTSDPVTAFQLVLTDWFFMMKAKHLIHSGSSNADFAVRYSGKTCQPANGQGGLFKNSKKGGSLWYCTA